MVCCKPPLQCIEYGAFDQPQREVVCYKAFDQVAVAPRTVQPHFVEPTPRRTVQRQRTRIVDDRPGHWTFPGSSRGQLIRHMMSGVHAGKFDTGYLQSLSFDEIQTLHDQDHERRTRRRLFGR